ncbi:MAG: hypothetical protein [Cotesia congregata filamentous virus 2]
MSNGINTDNLLKYFSLCLFTCYCTTNIKTKYIRYVIKDLLNADINLITKYRKIIMNHDKTSKDVIINIFYIALKSAGELLLSAKNSKTIAMQPFEYEVETTECNGVSNQNKLNAELLKCINDIYTALKLNINDKKILLINMIKIYNDLELLTNIDQYCNV